MNTAVARETLRYMRVFRVVYFGVSYVLYDTCVIAFFVARIGAMASSSTLPSSGEAIVFLSWVHGFIIYVAGV